jgi:hypothetical protein
MRKIIQITSIPSSIPFCQILHALRDDGTIWVRDGGRRPVKWKQVDSIPQETDDIDLSKIGIGRMLA